jgi:protein-L-isoaspartate(D-aspartate) O-methyltransferase
VSFLNHRIRLIMELRSAGVTDMRVLGAIERVPREAFAPAMFRDRAYEDEALPIGHGQTLSQPSVVALMTQALELEPRHKVLEIGTGSGYQASVLSRLCRRVYTVERHRELLREAEARLRDLRIHNIVTRYGDGWLGWPEQAPFERIIVTAAPPTIPERLVGQLAVGGFMVMPLGEDHGMQNLIRIHMTDEGPRTEQICAVRFVPMVPGLPDAEASNG